MTDPTTTPPNDIATPSNYYALARTALRVPDDYSDTARIHREANRLRAVIVQAGEHKGARTLVNLAEAMGVEVGALVRWLAGTKPPAPETPDT